MGCDIHVNIEYRHPVQGIEPVIAKHFYAGRDYDLFAALAGVRQQIDDPSLRPPFPWLIPPRGVPSDLSRPLLKVYYCQVLPDGASASEAVFPNCCSQQEATQYGKAPRQFGALLVIPNPDYHSASYLSRAEITAACEHMQYNLASAPSEFLLALDVMDSIDARFGEGASRMVFWFDG